MHWRDILASYFASITLTSTLKRFDYGPALAKPLHA
jgi:hypothetical protein